MKKFNFIPYFFSLLLVTDLYVFAIDSKEQRKLKNKIHNFSSKNIDTDMSTKWSLTGLYLEKYDDNYTFIKNPKLKMFDSNLITNISSETAIDPTGEMNEIYLKSNVSVNRNNSSNGNTIKLYTSYAIFYLTKDLIETDRDVTIITSDSTTTGNGLSANLDMGLITILSDAERTIKEGDQLQTIKGNQMIYNTKTDEWIVKNKPASNLKKSIKNKVTTTFNLN
ncbi:MAG: LPS export ABC transporter periplasmic protein LptC [Pseudomonadota bacterium]|jgi:LPS export ABC transporter protein LptC|nr:LPS export ABC transporter periplasmic protein LptC [Pseudomonadota bacterium]